MYHIGSSNDEQRLAEQIRRGDNTAMRVFCSLYVPHLKAVCARYIVNQEDVRDVLQEILISIITHISDFRYRGTGSLQAWSTRIAVNESLNFIRKIFPPIRNLSMKLASSRVASVLSMMLHSGFPTNEAFRLLPSVLSDSEAADKVQGIRRDLDNGAAFADAISNSKLFDPLHDRMIRMGVAAGREDQVMGKIADLYEEQVEEGIDRLVAIIEPTLIALLAVVIGAVLLSVMLPMAGILSSML